MTAFSTEERARLRALYEAFENPKGDSEAWGAPVETIDLADELIPAFPALMDALEQAERERDALRKAARSFLRIYDDPVGSLAEWEGDHDMRGHYERLAKLVGHRQKQPRTE